MRRWRQTFQCTACTNMCVIFPTRKADCSPAIPTDHRHVDLPYIEMFWVTEFTIEPDLSGTCGSICVDGEACGYPAYTRVRCLPKHISAFTNL